MRYALKLRFKDKETDKSYVLYSQIASIQTITGITSKQGRKHTIFWDIENTPLKKAVTVLKRVQKKYGLSNIYISSDYKKSFHAWCFSLVSFETMLKILIDSKSIIDWGFYVWTVRRRAATLRVSIKKGRPVQKVVRCLKSYYLPIPKRVVKVTYTTGEQKFPESISEKVSE